MIRPCQRNDLTRGGPAEARSVGGTLPERNIYRRAGRDCIIAAGGRQAANQVRSTAWPSETYC